MFGKFWQDIVLLVIAVALGVVLGLTLWGGAELKEVGHVRLVPDLLGPGPPVNRIVFVLEQIGGTLLR